MRAGDRFLDAHSPCVLKKKSSGGGRRQQRKSRLLESPSSSRWSPRQELPLVPLSKELLKPALWLPFAAAEKLSPAAPADTGLGLGNSNNDQSVFPVCEQGKQA